MFDQIGNKGIMVSPLAIVGLSSWLEQVIAQPFERHRYQNGAMIEHPMAFAPKCVAGKFSIVQR